MTWPGTLRDNVFVRLIAYYALGLTAIVLLFVLFPIIPEYMDAERARHIRTGSGFLVPADMDLPAFAVGRTALLQLSLLIPISISMAVAFGLALPIAWLYTWTRRGKKYNPSFAQTLVVVPIAISLVVFLVKGSLALSFSLAGIVASVRFRSSLSEPIDAIYLFMVIAVGLASGVQLLPVATVGSWCFVASVLFLWRTGFGDEPPVLVGWQLQPAGTMSGGDGTGGQQGAVKTDARDVLLRVQARDPGSAQQSIERVLNTHTKHWSRAESSTGVQVLIYDVRLKKGVSPDELASLVVTGCGAHITNVDVSARRPLKERL